MENAWKMENVFLTADKTVYPIDHEIKPGRITTSAQMRNSFYRVSAILRCRDQTLPLRICTGLTPMMRLNARRKDCTLL